MLTEILTEDLLYIKCPLHTLLCVCVHVCAYMCMCACVCMSKYLHASTWIFKCMYMILIACDVEHYPIDVPAVGTCTSP